MCTVIPACATMLSFLSLLALLIPDAPVLPSVTVGVSSNTGLLHMIHFSIVSDALISQSQHTAKVDVNYHIWHLKIASYVFGFI